MENLRQAWCVELFDAQVMIRGEEDWTGFYEYDAPGFQLSGFTIKDLADHFGIDVMTLPSKNPSSRLKRDITDVNVKLEKTLIFYDEKKRVEVKEIWCRVEGPNMLTLKILVEGKRGDGTVQAGMNEHFYCGKFAIQWKTGE